MGERTSVSSGSGTDQAVSLSDADGLAGADDAAGGGLEEEFGAISAIDLVVEGAAGFGFFLAGDLASFVGDAGAPDFLVFDG